MNHSSFLNMADFYILYRFGPPVRTKMVACEWERLPIFSISLKRTDNLALLISNVQREIFEKNFYMYMYLHNKITKIHESC